VRASRNSHEKFLATLLDFGSKTANISHRKILQVSAVILLAVPAFLIGYFILQNSINVPHWDQWSITKTIIKSTTGDLSFEDLIAQHNESRKIFPRLIYIALAYLTQYDVRYEILISFLLACLISLNLYRLSQITVQGDRVQTIALALVTNFLIFNPVQYRAWLLGLSSVFFIPVACITTSLVVAYSKLGDRAKFLICGGLSIISMFSFSSGILSWIVLLPTLVSLTQRHEESFYPSLIRRRWLLFGWVAAFAIFTAIYFYGYTKPTHHPSFAEPLKDPSDAVAYFLAFLGSPFAWGTSIDSLDLAQSVGNLLIMMLFLICLYLLKNRKNIQLWQRSVGWLTLAAYPLISGLTATAGRLGFGLSEALASRYTVITVHIFIATIYLAFLLIDDAISKKFFQFNRWTERFLIISISLFIGLYGLTYCYSMEQMNLLKSERSYFKTCLLFINVAPDPACLKKLYFGETEDLESMSNRLNDLGWMNPPLMRTNQIQDIANRATNSRSYGWLDNIESKGDRTYAIRGWAVLPTPDQTADAILITTTDQTGDSTLLKIIQIKTEKRADIAKTFHNRSLINSGWKGDFSLIETPEKRFKNVKVWAFDLQSNQAFELTSKEITLDSQCNSSV
jgi:hypothetical protein